MSFGFNSKFQDTAGKRNQLYNSVSNIFELSDKETIGNTDTAEKKPALTRQTTQHIIREIETDALRFHDERGSDKIKFFCK